MNSSFAGMRAILISERIHGISLRPFEYATGTGEKDIEII